MSWSGFELNQGPGKATSELDDKVIQQQQLGKATKDVVFRYAWMDMLTHMLKFRKWNTWPLNNTQVSTLFLS